MKTQEQKLQHVMEAAGECHHVRGFSEVEMPNGTGILMTCEKCGVEGRIATSNPSPDDLNELFRLAKKIVNISYLKFDFYKEYLAGCYLNGNIHITVVDEYAEGKDEAEALLNSLFIATGGIE